MGRPGQQSPSPRMNNNINPMFHPQPPPEQPPVYEKQIVEVDQKYPITSEMVNQPSGLPNMGKPAQPMYSPNAAPGYQPYGAQMPRQNFINQPYGAQTPRPNVQPSNWSSGLFDCMNDGENAIITCLFPFVTFGQIAEVTDEGATPCGTGGMLYGLICCLFAIPCVYSCTYRTKIRSKFGLPDAPAPDWITHCFCEYCALCQEYRELNSRGLNPSIGWSGNMQRQQQQEMMAPPMGQRMMS